MDERIRRLEAALSLDSRNSSKPPSSDGPYKKPPAKQTKSAAKKRGGQLGREGKALKMVVDPDHVKVIEPEACSQCGQGLERTPGASIWRRQVFEVPPMGIEVTEYQVVTKVCPCCRTKNRGEFPGGVDGPVQYGDRFRSLVAYLCTHQMIPHERIQESIRDLLGHTMGQGTIHNILGRFHGALEGAEAWIKEMLAKEPVLHADETGISVGGHLHWIHNLSSTSATYYHLDKKRGKEAMDTMGILPSYGGITIHDHWSPYKKYDTMEHAFCNAHHLRELTFIHEQEKEAWAKEMGTLLRNAHKAVKKAKEKGLDRLCASVVGRFLSAYEKILQSARVYDPKAPPDQEKKPGRPKQSKGKNLRDRLWKHKRETLRFITDFRVPFDNNLAERDLRMVKVKEKVSGCFMSLAGGSFFARIRGYISTLKKNKKAVLDHLQDALVSRAWLPSLAPVPLG